MCKPSVPFETSSSVDLSFKPSLEVVEVDKDLWALIVAKRKGREGRATVDRAATATERRRGAAGVLSIVGMRE